jgi:polyisoprenyl-teichoic acid--peptidoglycan teichoic acid transferase
MPHDDNEGRKPYKTYKAGRGRRSSVDEELAGARPARQRRPRPSSTEQPRADTAAGDKGYSRYRADGGDGGGYNRYEGAAVQKGRTNGRQSAKSDAARAASPARRRRFRWWHVPVALLLLVVIAAVVATVLAWPGYKTLDRAVTKANHRLGDGARAELTPDSGWIVRKPTTILLLGVDSKAGEPARSDTIMLMHFDPGKRTINQLSIPRDTRVDIPGRGPDKINAAMFWGHPQLAIKTVAQYLGIPINHIMVVNFKGFPRLVNAVDGVDLYVPKTISTTAGSSQRVVTYKKGWHHFDGKNAMLYVRIRKADSDFMRAKRQQQFMQALQKKIAQPSNITKIPEIGKRFMSGVTTDLTTNQIIELAFLKWRAKGGSKQVMVGEPAYIGGVAYVLPPSEAERQKMISRFLGG